MTWPAIVLWICIAAAIASRGPKWLLYIFYVSGAFGTLLMVPGDAVGGVNLLAQSFCALFIIAKLLLEPRIVARIIELALDLQKLGCLGIFLVWSLFTAYVMPRIFEGGVNVIPLTAVVPDPQPLVPTTANFTQSAYLTLSTLLVFVCAAAGNREFFIYFLRAVLLGSFALVLTGFLDLFTQGTQILAPFRNANYALMTDVEMMGSKRVVGLMPEASSYGSACLSLLSILVFLRHDFEEKLRKAAVPILIAGLSLMTILSTSSGGYVGLGALAGVYAGDLLLHLRTTDRAKMRRLILEIIFLASSAVVLLGIAVLRPSLFDPMSDLFDAVILQKSTSASFIERSGWTRYAWDAFLNTDGWGVGLGSARSSNWYVSILSNTGFLGAGFLSVFFIQLFLRRSTPQNRSPEASLRGLKLSVVPGLVTAALAGTTPDFGVQNAVIFGLITSLSFAPRYGGKVFPEVIETIRIAN